MKLKLTLTSIFYALITIFCFYSTQLHAQETNDEQVKRLQRSIFIYNFAQQVKWPNQADYSSFKIGVLGPDRTILDLKSFAQKRKIQNKTVEVVGFKAVKDISNIQALYVNNRFNFDVDYILNKISGQNILLITEDYQYNTSMINMVNVGSSFEYEINNLTLSKENFTIAPSLPQYAVTSSDKWKELYQQSQKTLKKTEEDVKEKNEELNKKAKEIANQKETISSQESDLKNAKENLSEQEKNVEKLITLGELQKQKYEDKLLLEKELEENIKQQIELIKIQKDSIKASNTLINDQKEFLDKQTIAIEEKEIILQEKDSVIGAQKKVNWLLFSIIGLTLIGSVLIYRNYLAKKKLTQTLEDKNKDIRSQSLLLESKNKELEQFAYITSHDLKEPLTTISGLITLLVDDYGDKLDESGKMSLDYINESSVRMQNLIDALLEYSRLGKSKTHEFISTNTILKQITDDLGNIINRTNAEVTISDLPNINGSKIEIRLLFQNLISNALKFTKPNVNPKVYVNCEKITEPLEDKQFWKFSVEDNGIGIEDKHKEKIFAIFQRLHTREEYEGTGIGLAHCKKIVESHGGKLWFESTLNEGSTFFFTIPEN